ncbi:MAG: C39 family peptidase [bacterium]
MKKHFLFFIFIIFNQNSFASFSYVASKFLTSNDFTDEEGNVSGHYVWTSSSKNPFTELILSWNALRPERGKFVFLVSVKHNKWTQWYKLAEWGVKSQQTFVNSRVPIVHAKHVRMVLTRGKKSSAFRIKVLAQNGADLRNLKSLFVNTCDMNKFVETKPDFKKMTTYIKGFPRQSQMVVGHPRFRDICSPTSLSMILDYYLNPKRLTPKVGGLTSFVASFADLVHDDSYLDIYGNWILNTAQVFDSSQGSVFCRAQRLNNFDELYEYLKNKTPVAVSIRGSLRGGRKPYDNGHFVVVIGWSQKKKAVICVDPAFSSSNKTLKAYPVKDFLTAWGKSRNLSYIAIHKNDFYKIM